MSNERQLINITLDQSESRIVETLGDLFAPPERTMSVYYGTQALFFADIFSRTPAARFKPVPGAAWLFGIDDVPFSAAPDYVLSTDEQFNLPGDRAGQDITNGEICWRARFDTAELLAALTAPKNNGKIVVPMFACLWMLTAAGNSLIAQWPVLIGKVFVDPTTATPVEGMSYASLAVVQGIIANILSPVAGLYRIKNGALQIFNADQQAYHTVSVSGAAGAETINIGPGESP